MPSLTLRGAAFVLLVALGLVGPRPAAFAQAPAVNGTSLAPFASGLQGPSSLARNASGVLYVASIYDKDGSGWPTDIFRVQPDGTVETFTPPLLDPDVLCLDDAGWIYLGAYGGKITKINPQNGSQNLWVSNWRLGNVDGMTFDSRGYLLVSAIDHKLIYQIEPVGRGVTLFADLSALPVSGFGSLVVDPATGAVFVASPHDGYLVKLNADGSLADAAFATGFQHMGQLAVSGDAIYASDNVAGKIYRIDLTTRVKSVFITEISYYAGALVSVVPGEFYASRQSADLTEGWIYHIAPMQMSLDAPARLGQDTSLHIESHADAGRTAYLFFSTGASGAPMADGRTLPLDPGAFVGPYLVTLDASGSYDFPMSIPDHAELAGLTFYAGFATRDDGASRFAGISEAYAITLE